MINRSNANGAIPNDNDSAEKVFMIHQLLGRQAGNKGSALVEFAVSAPFLILLTLGVIDFGRVFYDSIALANAADAGVLYGAQTDVTAGNIAGMQNAAALDAASDVSGVVVIAEQYCECPDSTAANCTTDTCAGYGDPQMYVKVTTQKSFETLFNYPGIPSGFEIGRVAVMRVQ